MNEKSLLKSTIAISIGLLVLVTALYIFNFHTFPISKDTQIWGSFGSYFGGMLGPLLSILNLLILVFITYQIAHLEDKRAETEITIQRKIALYSLKHDALKELNRILEQVQPELVRSESDSELKIILLRNNFNAFINTYSFLFPFFHEMTWKSLRESIEKISEICGRYYNSDHSLEVYKEILPELEKFNGLKTDFINEVQGLILD